MPNDFDNRSDLPLEETSGQNSFPVQHKQLDQGQKIAIAVLAFFAILVVIVWGMQAKRSLQDPFRSGDKQVSQTETCKDGNCGGVSEAVLRSKDTDHDGLSDYDELNLYKTSPYLEDSDSDGYSDKQEVESQNDPSCPFGQQCYTNPSLMTEQKDVDILPVQMKSAVPNTTGEVKTQINSAENVLSGQSDPAALRAVLLEYGMDKQSLEQISDEALMNTYKDILK